MLAYKFINSMIPSHCVQLMIHHWFNHFLIVRSFMVLRKFGKITAIIYLPIFFFCSLPFLLGIPITYMSV